MCKKEKNGGGVVRRARFHSYPHLQVRVYDMAMTAIREGTIRLRPVTPPQERQVGDAIVDVQSELRTKVLKQRRQEVSFKKEKSGYWHV